MLLGPNMKVQIAENFFRSLLNPFGMVCWFDMAASGWHFDGSCFILSKYNFLDALKPLFLDLFSRVARFFSVHDTKTGKNYHKMYQMVIKYPKCP
jgi:hypothetical protein